MQVLNVLALPLEEALKRLAEAGVECEIKVLLPPRESEAVYEGKEVRKYVVRQQVLPDDKLVLTIVYR